MCRCTVYYVTLMLLMPKPSLPCCLAMVSESVAAFLAFSDPDCRSAISSVPPFFFLQRQQLSTPFEVRNAGCNSPVEVTDSCQQSCNHCGMVCQRTMPHCCQLIYSHFQCNLLELPWTWVCSCSRCCSSSRRCLLVQHVKALTQSGILSYHQLRCIISMVNILQVACA